MKVAWAEDQETGETWVKQHAVEHRYGYKANDECYPWLAYSEEWDSQKLSWGLWRLQRVVATVPCIFPAAVGWPVSLESTLQFIVSRLSSKTLGPLKCYLRKQLRYDAEERDATVAIAVTPIAFVLELGDNLCIPRVLWHFTFSPAETKRWWFLCSTSGLWSCTKNHRRSHKYGHNCTDKDVYLTFSKPSNTWY